MSPFYCSPFNQAPNVISGHGPPDPARRPGDSSSPRNAADPQRVMVDLGVGVADGPRGHGHGGLAQLLEEVGVFRVFRGNFHREAFVGFFPKKRKNQRLTFCWVNLKLETLHILVPPGKEIHSPIFDLGLYTYIHHYTSTKSEILGQTHQIIICWDTDASQIQFVHFAVGAYFIHLHQH